MGYPTSTPGKLLAISHVGFYFGSLCCMILGIFSGIPAGIWGTPALAASMVFTAMISGIATVFSLIVGKATNPDNLHHHGLSNRQMGAAGGTGIALSLALAVGAGFWSYGAAKEKDAARAVEDAAPRAALLIECQASKTEATRLTKAFAEQKNATLSSEARAESLIPRDGCRVVTTAAPR